MDYCKLCIHMHIYIQPREYIMWWRRSNIIYWQPYGALQWQERKRANWLDDIWRVTPLLQYHYFLFLNVFSYIHCWYLDKVADKRNVVIFACQPRIDHFIRQFSKKPAGYMCYTFFLFSLSSKTIYFLVYFIRAFDLNNWVGIYTCMCRFSLLIECQNNTCSLFVSKDKCVVKKTRVENINISIVID